MSHVTVRVWVSRVREWSPGHVSLAIRPGARNVHNGYVSFAPVRKGSIYGPGKFYTLDDDLKEYGRTHHDGPRGHWVGKIHGLDAAKMLDHLRRDSRHALIYSPRNECANQVHKYLKSINTLRSAAATGMPASGRERRS